MYTFKIGKTTVTHPTMPTFDVEQDEIIAFEFDQTYLFKQYFDKDDLFQQLQEYYYSDKYRFEVPEEKLPEVRQFLDNYFYGLKIDEEPEDYCVVKDEQVNSSDILRNSVANQRKGSYEIYLMKDEISVRQAVEKGATRLEKTDLRKENIQWKIDGS
ncbi:hypothetical protein [Haloarcula brevis]|uniref:hypothetical protein n=1 Tax=Haloarcula brevis TaxID=3111453 RepID=UPI00300EED3D